MIINFINCFDYAPVCRHVTDESWMWAVMWRVSEMRLSND